MASDEKSKLPDGRAIRALEGGFTQIDMFNLHSRGLYDRATEEIMSLKDHDQSLQSNAYESMNSRKSWWRCREYVFYRKDPEAPLGKEITWIENGKIFKKLIPDVPIKVNGKDISLQKAVGMAVYPSIDLLKIERMGSNMYVVSVVDPAAIAGKVRVVDFIRDGWALTDDSGLPIARKPSSPNNPNARHGAARTDWDESASGWHGSLARDSGKCEYCDWRDINANEGWSFASGVAVVSREA